MSIVKDFKWNGQKVKGTVEAEYKSSKGKRYFIKLAKVPADLKGQSTREGHPWPTVGSVVLADTE